MVSNEKQVVYERIDMDASTAAHIGQPFPAGELVGADGQPASFANISAGRVAVVVFYRGAWCPYCNIALRAYEAELVPSLRERGAILLAVSPELPDGSLSITQKQQLSFDVLSDPGNSIARALGLLAPQSAEVTEARLSRGVDLEAINADGTTDLVHPATIVVDATGTIRWIDVHADYTTRSAPADILAAVANADNPAA